MSIEFRLDRSDHRIVEKYLEGRPTRVGAVIIEATNLERQHDAVAAARSAGLDVVVETLTERLAHPGLNRTGLDYFTGEPLEPGHFARAADGAEFVKRVTEVQLDHGTVIVPPHFFADDRATLDLNVDLVAATASLVDDRPVRAVITAPRSLFRKTRPAVVAKRYRLAGASQVDLRLSPLGGHDNGPRKIADALEIASAFTAEGLRVTLGQQGEIGPLAIAAGAADSFSVGIGYRERLDFKSMIYSQKREPHPDADFGSPAGIYLPGPGITVRRGLGRELLADTKLRGKLGVVSELLADPQADPRGPYLVSRHEQLDELLGRPPAWRVQHELDRVTRAKELREIINDYHLPPSISPLATTTLESLQIVCRQHLDAA